MKAGQAEKFMKAREDPSFANAMQIKELSPQQAADQIRLRKVVQMTEARLDELEVGIAGLKRRSKRDNARPSQPALERIQRSVRNLDVAMRDRQQTIEDLSRRVGGLRLSHSHRRSHSRESTPALEEPERKLERKLSTSRTSAPAPKVSLEPTEAMQKAAAKALSSRPRVARRSEAPVTKVGHGASGLLAHASVLRGPVKMDSAPMPGSGSAPLLSSTNGHRGTASTSTLKTQSTAAATQPPVASTAQVAPPTTSAPPPFALSPSPPPASSAPSFAGITFQLDPGDSSPTTTKEGGGSRRGAVNRSHAPAPKLTRTPVLNTTGEGFFGAPAPPKTDSKAPAGFVR